MIIFGMNDHMTANHRSTTGLRFQKQRKRIILSTKAKKNEKKERIREDKRKKRRERKIKIKQFL